jgi:hypothetical protein
MPHVSDNGEIGLENLPAFVQLLEVAFRHADWIALAKRKMQEIKQMNCECPQYYAELQVIVADQN